MFFFFKQKTAYELRISDWSSDVCSSDLAVLLLVEDGVEGGALDRRDPARLHPRGGGQGRDDDVDHPLGAVETRSEEHTSELQSLMRISYAVFCLKKTTTTNLHHQLQHTSTVH